VLEAIIDEILEHFESLRGRNIDVLRGLNFARQPWLYEGAPADHSTVAETQIISVHVVPEILLSVAPVFPGEYVSVADHRQWI
jgi:hypothetical protein